MEPKRRRRREEAQRNLTRGGRPSGGPGQKSRYTLVKSNGGWSKGREGGEEPETKEVHVSLSGHKDRRKKEDSIIGVDQGS